MYASAQEEWIEVFSVAARLQSKKHLSASASDLQIGQTEDTGGRSGYPNAVAELNQPAGLPGTDDTAVQQAEALADVTALQMWPAL